MATEINFKDLTKELPYKWRVQSFSKFKPEATCVAYVDSRDVQKLLDEVAGPENWQDEYYAVKNNLFCRIGIRVNGEWTWKGDCGTESNVDKEKGEASDAFKRAAVKWGIGRFLYDLGMYKVKADKKLGESPGNPAPIEDNGQRIWDLTKHINALINAKKESKKPAAGPAKAELVKQTTHEPASDELKEAMLNNMNGFTGLYSVIDFKKWESAINALTADKAEETRKKLYASILTRLKTERANLHHQASPEQLDLIDKNLLSRVFTIDEKAGYNTANFEYDTSDASERIEFLLKALKDRKQAAKA